MKIKYKFAVGDNVWYVPDNSNIMIKVNVIELDDSLGYWINEPVGRPVDECELFAKEEDARKELINKKKDEKAINDLDQFRKVGLNHILLSMDEKLEIESVAKYYIEKKHKESWLHITDLKI